MFVGRLCGFAVWQWEQTYLGLCFLPVWHGGIPDSLLLLFMLWVPVGAAACCCIPLRFVGLAVEGFLIFLEFLAPFFSDFVSLDFVSPLGPGGVGATLLVEGYPGWASTRDIVEDLLCYLFSLLLQLATGSLEGLETGLEEVCLSCLYIAFCGFLFWLFQWFIRLSDNRVVGSGPRDKLLTT